MKINRKMFLKSLGGLFGFAILPKISTKKELPKISTEKEMTIYKSETPIETIYETYVATASEILLKPYKLND